jgi:hypothetical protein
VQRGTGDRCATRHQGIRLADPAQHPFCAFLGRGGRDGWFARLYTGAQCANQEEYNYLLNYHAMSDTFDKVDLAQLKKHVAEAAALTFGIANAAARPGPRLHHAEIEQTLRETHLDEQLKTFGMWSAWENGKWGRKD